jgi:hypothetical protein
MTKIVKEFYERCAVSGHFVLRKKPQVDFGRAIGLDKKKAFIISRPNTSRCRKS